MISNINRYTTKEEWFLGKGSFGSVYKAEKGGKFYAIKIFQSEYLKDEYRRILDREVDALRKIEHPNVVALHESGTFNDKGFDYFYIVMDFIEGKKLSEYVGTIDEATATNFIKSILDTLNAVHTQGVIHRDLKPDNIMICPDGRAVILDFGLSKLIDYTSIAQTGDQIGTFYYMSPEQITDSKNIDPLSDYFAVGVILYQLLTGVLPFTAPNLAALVEEIQKKYPKSPSDINPNLSNRIENIILKLLEKQPYKRYQSVEEIMGAFDEELPPKRRRLTVEIRNYLRLLHNEKAIFSAGLEQGLIDAVIFPSNFFTQYGPTTKLIAESGIAFATDPATNRLTYSAFSKTTGVQELPYSSGDETLPIQKKDFNSISQVQEYVEKVVSFQIEHGVNELVAPFFFARDTSDDWFAINLKLLKETIDLRDREYPDVPLWGGICMNVSNWHDEDVKNAILNKYVKNAPDGYFVYGDPIGNTSNLTEIFHYTDLLKKLQDSAEIPVVACRVNGFGAVLLSLGISGISSGAGSLDSFKESILSDEQEGYSAGPRYYIPELMSMISLDKGITTKLKDIEKSSIGGKLKCPCEYCKDMGENLSHANIKMHFLNRRKQEIEEIKMLDAEKRIAHIEQKIEQAIVYQKTLKSEGIKISSDFSYLDTWKTLVEKFKKKD